VSDRAVAPYVDTTRRCRPKAGPGNGQNRPRYFRARSELAEGIKSLIAIRKRLTGVAGGLNLCVKHRFAEPVDFFTSN
jgi:hypothetical protein